MINVIGSWFRRYFSNPQAVFLAVVLVLGFTVVLTMGYMLIPLLAAVVIAYLLEGLVAALERRGTPRIWAVLIVFSAFLAFVAVVLLGIVPLLGSQVKEFFRELPNYINQGQAALQRLPEHYSYITQGQINDFIVSVRGQITGVGQHIVTLSLASIPGLITLVVYLILVPLLVFFFLKDKQLIVGWGLSFLPRERSLAARVWHDVDVQLGNYVRGKFWEILIVGLATYVGFAVMDMKYAILMAVLVGLSVIIPYIGATVVTIPVALVAYFQWGWSADFAYLMIFYLVVQALDGNLLVPLLFSEVVNLHPVAIIVSILVFGGLWGFWGVFFAIPLATLVKVLLDAWPRTPQPGDSDREEEAEAPA